MPYPQRPLSRQKPRTKKPAQDNRRKTSRGPTRPKSVGSKASRQGRQSGNGMLPAAADYTLTPSKVREWNQMFSDPLNSELNNIRPRSMNTGAGPKEVIPSMQMDLPDWSQPLDLSGTTPYAHNQVLMPSPSIPYEDKMAFGPRPESSALERARQAQETGTWTLGGGERLPLGDVEPMPVDRMMANDPVAEYWRNRVEFDPEAEAMGEIGPNASSLLQYMNTPEMERPPIRPGWKTRFAGGGGQRLRPRSAPENPWEMSDEEIAAAEEAKARVPASRLEELDELLNRRAERFGAETGASDRAALNAAPGQQPENPPMAIHPGTATSGVSAVPRPLTEVANELQGRPNYDHAAGPQNEKWQAAREKRQEAREERLSRHQAQEAEKAEARQRRLQQRQTASRPRSAGGAGALWRINPEAAAQLATRRGISRDQARAELMRQQNELRATRPQRLAQQENLEADTEHTRAETGVMESAADDRRQLSNRMSELSAQLNEMRPDNPARGPLEDELDRVTDRLNAIDAGEMPVGGGRDDEEISRVTEEGEEVTRDLDRDLSRTGGTDVGQYYQIDENSPQTGSDLAELLYDGLGAGAPIPQGNDLESLTQGLRIGSGGVDPSGEQSPDYATLQQSASRLPGDPTNQDEAIKAAEKRVQAAMKHFSKPEGKRGDPPVVNGYKLSKKTKTVSRSGYNPYYPASPSEGNPNFYEREYYSWERVN